MYRHVHDIERLVDLMTNQIKLKPLELQMNSEHYARCCVRYVYGSSPPAFQANQARVCLELCITAFCLLRRERNAIDAVRPEIKS